MLYQCSVLVKSIAFRLYWGKPSDSLFSSIQGMSTLLRVAHVCFNSFHETG
jgi:hypothetical protein